MADYPESIYDPRTVANVDGTVYEPTETTRIFAEDVNLANDEIVAIEETLGENPQGDFETVAERLEGAALKANTPYSYSGFGQYANININSISPVDIASFEIPELLIGSTLLINLAGALFNNSGGSRVYTIRVSIDGKLASVLTGTVSNSATLLSTFLATGRFSTFGSDLIAGVLHLSVGAGVASTQNGNIVAAQNNIVRLTAISFDNLAVPVVVSIFSNSSAGTQLIQYHGCDLTILPPNL